MTERKQKSMEIIRRAREAVMNHDIASAVRLYCEGFYLRNVVEDIINIEFASFYRYQFSVYLSGKKRITLSLAEGDMIFDLISSVFEEMKISMEESPFNISAEGQWNLLKEVHIDFPCQNNPFESAI